MDRIEPPREPPPHGLRPPMPASASGASWQELIDAADSPAEVCRLAREYLAGFSPADLATLPHDCRPPARLEPRDIASFAIDLLRREHSELPRVHPRVYALARFFSHAATRLAELSSPIGRGRGVLERPLDA